MSLMVRRRHDAYEKALVERVPVWEPRPGWRELRGCLNQPSDWWFEGGWKPKGQGICQQCRVRMDCVTDTIREERALGNLEDELAGYRGVAATHRRAYILNERRAL